jgi:hypothetical protein
MNHLKLASRLAPLLCAAVLAGCGGGDDDPTTVTLTSFTLSATTLTPSSSGPVTLRASFNATSQTTTNNNTKVTLSLYVIPASAPADSVGAIHRVAIFDCPLFSFLCASVECAFSSDRLFGCGVPPGLTLQPGNYTAVGRACVKNNANLEICAEQRVPLTVN